jgi:hypothetical protein
MAGPKQEMSALHTHAGAFSFKEDQMASFTLTSVILAALAGAVLSLLFSYIPGLNTWYAGKGEEVKKLIMLALLFLVAIVLFVLQCYSILDAGLTCDQQGVIQLAWIFISAIVTNQSVFKISPQLAKVKKAKIHQVVTFPPFKR